MANARDKIIWSGAAAYTAALVAVSLLPSGANAPVHWDEGISPTLQDALHIPAYAGLLLVTVAAWRTRRDVNWLPVMTLALACIGFGTILELAQAAIPGRTASWGDGLSNALGVLIGVPLALILSRTFRKRPAGTRLAPEGGPIEPEEE